MYGISAWNVQLDRAKQENLVITDYDEPTIMVDNLKIAQFIYLLLNNEEIRDAIDTIAKKAVLILGRFTFERKVVLARLCTILLSNKQREQAEKELNWGLKPHQDQWVMWEKRNCPTDAASRLPRHHQRSQPVCDTRQLA